MVTAGRLSRQRRFNAWWMGTLARPSRPRPPITTRRVSFEVALLERFCWPKAFIIVAWGIAPGIENKGN
jgi:hypothetical protein